jgi:bifunctional DNA-binding transcriptional regulator/antitoxin component of YhaV-PrlF toxin-antitoxin module
MHHTNATTKIVRPLRGGQITIPATFRKQLGIDEQTLLQMTLSEGELHIKPVAVHQLPQGSSWLRDLYDYFAPVRDEALAKGYTENEINDAIDDAVAAVRIKQRSRE